MSATRGVLVKAEVLGLRNHGEPGLLAIRLAESESGPWTKLKELVLAVWWAWVFGFPGW